jgi:hypothetical protein
MNRTVLYTSILGAFVGAATLLLGLDRQLSLAPIRYDPLPHQVPKYPGGISLRFAMVHDVIHERYPKHGPDYYRHRTAAALAQIEKLKASPPPTTRPIDSPEWPLLDDIAVGHVNLGEFDAAITLMRDKLARQQKLAVADADLYPTYANLGTALMIDALVKAQAGKDATDELKESLVWVRKSIAANPQAHFGREVWQVALGEYLLDAQRHPSVLTTYDMIGDERVDSSGISPARYRPSSLIARLQKTIEQRPGDEGIRKRIREEIPRVGAEGDWDSATHTSCPEPVPFDEPVLGIIGMWRYGGGANPHFALALGETMARVGQLPLAWSAFERCARLVADKDPALLAHCRTRQKSLEEFIPDVSPQDLRAAFDADLKAGLDYQAAYQQYESEKLAAGASVDDPHFYDAFFAAHGDIASAPGHADEVAWQETDGLAGHGPAVLFGAGLFALIAAVFQRFVRQTTDAPSARP